MDTRLFDNIFDASSFTIEQFLLTLSVAIMTGLIISLMDTFRGKEHSRSFIVTLALLPSIVAVVIMVVGNNIGAGIAVAGAFTLVKFRSIPGTAEEIGFIFLAMASGLLIGSGLLAYGVLFVIIIGSLSVILATFGFVFGEKKMGDDIILKVTIPDDLEYNTQIEPVIDNYSVFSELLSLKTVNMGTMFRLTYHLRLKDKNRQKELVDTIRARNSNLEVALAPMLDKDREL